MFKGLNRYLRGGLYVAERSQPAGADFWGFDPGGAFDLVSGFS